MNVGKSMKRGEEEGCSIPILSETPKTSILHVEEEKPLRLKNK